VLGQLFVTKSAICTRTKLFRFFPYGKPIPVMKNIRTDSKQASRQAGKQASNIGSLSVTVSCGVLGEKAGWG